MTELARIEILGAEELARAFKQSPRTVSAAHSAAMHTSLGLIEREIKEITPVGASGGGGGLSDSIEARPVQVTSDKVLGVVGTDMLYAEAVELGTAAHEIPVKEIEGSLTNWVHAKLGVPSARATSVAYAVANRIAKVGTSSQARKVVGTKGWRMFERGFEATRPQVERIFQSAAERILRMIAGGR